MHHLFDVDSFTIYPYQLGDHNEERLASGAWWFYQKLGFRARDPRVLKLMDRELARMRRTPGYRSDIETLAKGGRRESDFVRAFDKHRPLRNALRRLIDA